MNHPTETSRLQFQNWSSEDTSLAQALWGNEKVTKWIDARGKLSPEDVHAKLLQEIETAETHGVQYWPIFLKSGEHVGCAGLRPYKPSEKVYELGFHLLPDYWGRGLASEAARGVMKYAFTALTATALFAGHNPNNKASRRLLEKLGFQHIGEEHYPPTGLLHPSYLLKSENWKKP